MDRGPNNNGICHLENNMEHTDKIKKQERLQIVIAIGIYLAIILLLIAIIAVVKNANEIKLDPIIYGVQKHEYAICSCYDKQGNNFDFNSEGYIPKKNFGWNLNLTPIR